MDRIVEIAYLISLRSREMISTEIRRLWEKNKRNEKIFPLLECFHSSKKMSELPLRTAAISVASDIPENIKKRIVSLVIFEYTNPAISSATIYESAFIGSDYLFGLLFEKGFIVDDEIRNWVFQQYNLSALVPILNSINKHHNDGQSVERLTNYLLSLLGQKEKQNLFENLLRNFGTDKNLFIIQFLINMHGVRIPKFIDIDVKNERGYLPCLDRSDTFAYFVNLYRSSETEAERIVYDNLITLLFKYGMQLQTILRRTNIYGVWDFEDISYYITESIEETTISKLYLEENQNKDRKTYSSVYYFYYYDFTSNINDLTEFKYYAVRDVIEYGRQNNIYVFNVEIDDEKMVITYSCDGSVDVNSLMQDMRNELCCGNYYQILFPSVFSEASNIWVPNIYTEEGSITIELLTSFKRKQQQKRFPKK